jgi:hypothetical protein
MKMMFFSSERAEVERLRQELKTAGMPCEVRESGVVEGIYANAPDVELWLQNDDDYYWASMLCVRLGLGFARRIGRIQDLAA